jgi:hypothetical protein
MADQIIVVPPGLIFFTEFEPVVSYESTLTEIEGVHPPSWVKDDIVSVNLRNIDGEASLVDVDGVDQQVVAAKTGWLKFKANSEGIAGGIGNVPVGVYTRHSSKLPVNPSFSSVKTLQGFDGDGPTSEDWRTDESSAVLWQVYPFGGLFPSDVSITPTLFGSRHSVFFDEPAANGTACLRAGSDVGFLAGVELISYPGPSTKECWIYPVNGTTGATTKHIFTLGKDDNDAEHSNWTWRLAMERDTYVLSGSIQKSDESFVTVTHPTALIPNQWNHVFFQAYGDEPTQPYFGVGANGTSIWSGTTWDGTRKQESPYFSSIGGCHYDPGGRSVNAYLDEIRMTRNNAVYDAGSSVYPVPVAVFPRS